ncbi:MAG TPA: hypothetical protein GX534_01145 [Thermoanaerobacterales bacterium]|jgi:hypothetical protein|nr:hypothetical protein [Thermoanaerobacterales bacterium]
MLKTVIGVFESREQAEKCVSEMRASGFTENEISILVKGNEGQQDDDYNAMGMDTLSSGTATGGVLGGLAGLALGAGALAIPGLGPIFAAGPIAGLLSGAATGGIAGGLIDWGIPEERGRFYEGEVRKGKILATVRAHEQKISEAADIMRRNEAKDVETH